MNFEDKKCPVCEIYFKSNDDIVVCSDCGTPYHRNCFKKIEKCINQNHHNLNNNFNDINNKTQDFNSTDNNNDNLNDYSNQNICPNCKTSNPKNYLFCEICGTNLSLSNETYNTNYQNNTNPFDNPYGDFHPNDKIAGQSVRNLTLFIGPNSRYFLNKFKDMENGKKITFNWSATILGPLYLAYRKNYLVAILYFVLIKIFELTTYIVQFNIISSSSFMPEFYNINSMPLIFLYSFDIINILLRILCGALFNYFYMKKAISTINKYKHLNQNESQFSCKLTKIGTVSLKLIIVFFIINMIISFSTVLLMILYST